MAAGGATEGHPQHAAPINHAAPRGIPGKGAKHQAHAHGGGGGELGRWWLRLGAKCWRGGDLYFPARHGCVACFPSLFFFCSF